LEQGAKDVQIAARLIMTIIGLLIGLALGLVVTSGDWYGWKDFFPREFLTGDHALKPFVRAIVTCISGVAAAVPGFYAGKTIAGEDVDWLYWIKKM
jgi:hypothetical protein